MGKIWLWQCLNQVSNLPPPWLAPLELAIVSEYLKVRGALSSGDHFWCQIKVIYKVDNTVNAYVTVLI
jgi:hypothetical protein